MRHKSNIRAIKIIAYLQGVVNVFDLINIQLKCFGKDEITGLLVHPDIHQCTHVMSVVAR
jgi:hypothetical protein